MEVTDTDLERIASDIWAAMLGLELKPNRAVDTYEPDLRVVTGCVQIAGQWEGAVTLQASETLGLRAASLMFDMQPDDVTAEELSDAIGELANMTGGNVKSLVPGAAQLSLPSVTTGRDYQVSVPGTLTAARLGLDCDGELVVVTLLERQQSTA